MIQNAGTQAFTAAGVVGASGKAVRIYMLHIISDGTAGVTSLKNGTSSAGTIYVTETGTISTGKTVLFGGSDGMVFPSGCYVDADAHSVNVTVTYNYLS